MLNAATAASSSTVEIVKRKDFMRTLSHVSANDTNHAATADDVISETNPTPSLACIRWFVELSVAYMTLYDRNIVPSLK